MRSGPVSRSAPEAVRSAASARVAASLESSHDPRLLIGLGPEIEARKITIRWPSGIVSTVERLAADATHLIVEPQLTATNQSPP